MEDLRTNYWYDKCLAFAQMYGMLSDEITNKEDSIWMLKMLYDFTHTRMTSCKDVETWDKFWRRYYNCLLEFRRKYESLKKEVLLEFSIKNDKWFFMTVGYDDKTITNEKIKSLSEKVANMTHWEKCIYVNEKFRKNDKGEIYIHHHTHFLLTTSLPKSKVIQYVYQAVKSAVASKNFIDVKGNNDKNGTFEQKQRYIAGDKISEKMECVRMDAQWREEFKIPSRREFENEN